MQDYKTEILEKICYTKLVYARINKKLSLHLSEADIEQMIFRIIQETEANNFHKIGKNIYIINKSKNLKLTINSSTKRIITIDKLKIE